MSTEQLDLPDRIRAAFYGLAVCDAFGAPLEFKPRRNPGQYVHDMMPNDNFGLRAGHFTDDTSMALCLATSLATTKGEHDGVHQAGQYVMWWRDGYMSSTSAAFDIGIQTKQALQYWEKKLSLETQDFIDEKFKDERRCGNGSLMRVLPCALVAQDEEDAMSLARQSSRVTHPHTRCLDACALYARLVFQALRGANKEQLIGAMKSFFIRSDIDQSLQDRLQPYTSVATFASKARDEISSSGYVLDSLEASLWAFFTTETFEEGAIAVVNLGDDADTVGAIYGGLAAAFYGNVATIPERWLKQMKKMQLIDNLIDRILDVHRERGQLARS